jgi:hypothetical protein
MTTMIFLLAAVVAFCLGYACPYRRPKLPPPPPPAPTPQQRKLLGLDTPGDQRVPVPFRDWTALKLALWRSKVAWDVALRALDDVLERCVHAEGCPGKVAQGEPCLRECRDREVRMSALVAIGAARQLAPVDARRPGDAPYFAPSREYFGEVMAELAAAQIELEVLRAGADEKVLSAIERALRTVPVSGAETAANRLKQDSYENLLDVGASGCESEEEEKEEETHA